MVGKRAVAKIQAVRQGIKVSALNEAPFFQYIQSVQPTQEQLTVFFCQYYTIVKVSFRMLAAGILSAEPEDAATIKNLARFLASEAGCSPNHLEEYLQWAAFFGVSVDELSAAKPIGSSRELEAVLMSCFASSDSLVKLSAQLAVEDCAEALIVGLDRGFQRYSMTVKARAYLARHLLIENDEEGHSRWAIEAVAACPHVGERLEEVEETYRLVYRMFAGLFQGILDAWKVSVPPAVAAVS